MKRINKPGAGRPEKPDDERKDKRIQIRVTAAELKTLEQRAVLEGLTVAEYVRRLVGL